MAGLVQLLRFAGFRQRQHGFDVHFDCSFYGTGAVPEGFQQRREQEEHNFEPRR